MLAINNRQYLSVITTTGADIHCTVTYESDGRGRDHVQTELTAITAAVASPGTSILSGPTQDPHESFKIHNVTIRNIDTTSQTITLCIVEMDDAGTQTVYQLKKETIATGQEWTYEAGAGFALDTHNTIGVWTTAISAVATTNQTADVLGAITGLSVPVLSGNTYEFKAVIGYTSGATTTGVRFVTNGPAITNLSGRSSYPITATTQTVNFFTDHGVPAAANADTLAAGGTAILEGMFKPSADGNLTIEFASENNAQVVTALAGATLMVRRTL